MQIIAVRIADTLTLSAIGGSGIIRAISAPTPVVESDGVGIVVLLGIPGVLVLLLAGVVGEGVLVGRSGRV